MSGAVDIAAPVARNDRILRALDRLSEGVLVAALLGELAAVLANVFVRSFFGRSFLWTDEVARMALSLLTFVGGIVAYRHGHHAFVRVVLNALPAWFQRAGCSTLRSPRPAHGRRYRDHLAPLHRIGLGRADADPAAAGGDDSTAPYRQHGASRLLGRSTVEGRKTARRYWRRRAPRPCAAAILLREAWPPWLLALWP